MFDKLRAARVLALAGLALALVACGAAGGAPRARSAATPRRAHWTAFRHAVRPVDLAGPRADGTFVLEANGRLWTLTPSGRATPIDPAYRVSAGEEPYIALAPRGGCFARGAVYAIRLHAGRGITEIDRAGHVRRVAAITAPGLINGIAFDTTGRFGHRLLVTVNAGSRTTVLAIDCRGRVRTLTRAAPRVEGGIAVAPASFGRFAGELIAPDEIGGNLYAISPSGASTLLAASGIAHGQDTGVESEAFMPARHLRPVLVSDRLTPRNHHPGDDVILRIGASALRAAGVRPGDLLVAGEGGAQTVAVHCGFAACTVTHVADGPPQAHVEGHIAVEG
jgi:hypothetical protein